MEKPPVWTRIVKWIIITWSVACISIISILVIDCIAPNIIHIVNDWTQGIRSTQVDGIVWRYSLYDNGVTIRGVKSTCATESITIPKEIKNKPVTCIGDDAFNGCSALKGIVIPNSVTNIANSAFDGCVGLENITIPLKLVGFVRGDTFQVKHIDEGRRKKPIITCVIDLFKGSKLELIPAGMFMMGSPESEKGNCKDEQLHKVKLTKDFWLGKFEIMKSIILEAQTSTHRAHPRIRFQYVFSVAVIGVTLRISAVLHAVTNTRR